MQYLANGNSRAVIQRESTLIFYNDVATFNIRRTPREWIAVPLDELGAETDAVRATAPTRKALIRWAIGL